MFATAIAGIPTPLSPEHWYWITLSGVPGLLTFTTVSIDVFDSTSELPTLVHVMLGLGLPDELQNNEMLFLSTTKSVVVLISIDAVSAKKIVHGIEEFSNSCWKKKPYASFYCWLTNNGDVDSSILSRAQWIDRKTSVTSIYIDSNIQKAVTAVTN